MARLGPHQIPTATPGCVIESLLAKGPRLWEWNAQSLRACNKTSGKGHQHHDRRRDPAEGRHVFRRDALAQ